MKVGTETQGLLSVIVPVYNGAAFLADAIESILRQQCQPREILLIDDGSTDDTRAIAERYAASTNGLLRYVYQENAGPSSARNHGLNLAKGEFAAFLDADDLWPDDSLAIRVQALQTDPANLVVMGQVRLFPETEDSAFPGPNLGAGLFRKSVFAQVGAFDTALRTSEDVDWFLRAREQSIPIQQIDTITLLYRRHDASLTHQKTASDLHLLQVLKRSLERRRSVAASLPAEVQEA